MAQHLAEKSSTEVMTTSRLRPQDETKRTGLLAPATHACEALNPLTAAGAFKVSFSQ